MTKKVKYGLLLVIILGAYGLGRMGYSEKQVVVKEVTKYKTIDRIITKPDGTKIVEIIKEIDKSTEKSTKIVRATQKNTIVSLSGGCSDVLRCQPIYGVSFSKRVLLGAYMGVYARTDKEIGVILSYSF